MPNPSLLLAYRREHNTSRYLSKVLRTDALSAAAACAYDRAMTSIESDLDKLLVTERELWQDGPPHEVFKRLRSECPVHFTSAITEYPTEKGFWSLTTADDIHAVSRDWKTYSSETGGVTAINIVFPLELTRAMFIGMDPPKHDRVKALFQAGGAGGVFQGVGPAEARPRQGALPGGLHSEAHRRPRGRDPRDRHDGARPPRGPRLVRPRRGRRPAGRRARDRQLHGHPARGRRGLGAAHELDARGGRPGPQPGGRRGRHRQGRP